MLPHTDRHGLKDQAKVEQLQNKVISSLRDHVIYNSEAQKKVNYFSKLLSYLPELRSLSVEGSRRLKELSKIVQLPHSLDTVLT